MATKSGTGIVPILLLVGAAVVFGPQLVDEAKNQLAELTADTSVAYQVAPGAKPKTDKCTADQLLKNS